MEIFPCPDIQKSIVSIPEKMNKKNTITGCPIWIVAKVNEYCEYVFGARHFFFQIYPVNMCTFSFLDFFFNFSKGALTMIWGIFQIFNFSLKIKKSSNS